MVKVDSSYHQWWATWTGPEWNSEIWNFLDSSYCFGHHDQSVAPIDTKPLGLVRRRAPLRHGCVGFPNIIKIGPENWSEKPGAGIHCCFRNWNLKLAWPTGHDRSGPLWHYSSKHGRPVKTGQGLFGQPVLTGQTTLWGSFSYFPSFFSFLLSSWFFGPPWVFIQGS